MYQSSLTITAEGDAYSMFHSWHKDSSNKFYEANGVDEQKLCEKLSLFGMEHSSGKDVKEVQCKFSCCWSCQTSTHASHLPPGKHNEHIDFLGVNL